MHSFCSGIIKELLKIKILTEIKIYQLSTNTAEATWILLSKILHLLIWSSSAATRFDLQQSWTSGFSPSCVWQASSSIICHVLSSLGLPLQFFLSIKLSRTVWTSPPCVTSLSNPDGFLLLFLCPGNKMLPGICCSLCACYCVHQKFLHYLNIQIHSHSLSAFQSSSYLEYFACSLPTLYFPLFNFHVLPHVVKSCCLIPYIIITNSWFSGLAEPGGESHSSPSALFFLFLL